MKKVSRIIGILLAVLMLLLTASAEKPYEGVTVTFYGWGGDERTNAYLDDVLAPYVRETMGIILRRVPMDITDILARLTNEKGRTAASDIDLVWINGENFLSARKNGLLYGPFTDGLENLENYADPETGTEDFGVPTEGYEAPWGRAQFVLFYDSEKVPNPPRNAAELLAWCRENPGTFTYPQAADFTASAFIRTILFDLVGRENLEGLQADYDTVKAVIAPAIDYLNELEPYLWRSGETYPATSTQLETLYAEGEVLFAMDYSACKALSMAASGAWTAGTRTLVPERGTPYNIHFLAIAANSAHPEAAAAVINAALSPEMQTAKADLKGWADLPVIAYNRLSTAEQEALNTALTAPEEYAETILSFEELDSHKQAELRADLVDVIEQIWIDDVLNK